MSRTIIFTIFTLLLSQGANSFSFTEAKEKARLLLNEVFEKSEHNPNSGFYRRMNIGKCGAGHTPYNCEFPKRKKRQRGPRKKPRKIKDDTTRIGTFLNQKGNPTVTFKTVKYYNEDGNELATVVAVDKKTGTETPLHKRLFEIPGIFTRDNLREFFQFLEKQGSFFDYLLDKGRPVEEAYYAIWDRLPNDRYIAPHDFLNFATEFKLLFKAANEGTNPPSKGCEQEVRVFRFSEEKKISRFNRNHNKKGHCVFTGRDFKKQEERLKKVINGEDVTSFFLNLDFNIISSAHAADWEGYESSWEDYESPKEEKSSATDLSIDLSKSEEKVAKNSNKEKTDQIEITLENRSRALNQNSTVENFADALTKPNTTEKGISSWLGQVKKSLEDCPPELIDKLRSSLDPKDHALADKYEESRALGAKMLENAENCGSGSLKSCILTHEVRGLLPTDAEKLETSIQQDAVIQQLADINGEVKETMNIISDDGEVSVVQQTRKEVAENGWKDLRNHEQDPSAYKDYSDIKDPEERLAVISADLEFAAAQDGKKLTQEEILILANQVSQSEVPRINFQNALPNRKVKIPSSNSSFTQKARNSYRTRINEYKVNQEIKARKEEIRQELGENATFEKLREAFKNDPKINNLKTKLDSLKKEGKKLREETEQKREEIKQDLFPDEFPGPSPTPPPQKPRKETQGRGRPSINPNGGGQKRAFRPRGRSGGRSGGISHGSSGGSGPGSYSPSDYSYNDSSNDSKPASSPSESEVKKETSKNKEKSDPKLVSGQKEESKKKDASGLSSEIDDAINSDTKNKKNEEKNQKLKPIQELVKKLRNKKRKCLRPGKENIYLTNMATLMGIKRLSISM
ncbi:MAG: hypothetical protein H6622_17335 [Halobacteriovoraceae bacterium]|nr:hypothetical protein [Halobacteriovoraceae bacterium]